jgi:High potential iron-sulfur protein
MSACDRRTFLLRVVAATSALTVSQVHAADETSDEPVLETDAYPKSMGFRLDTAKVDQAKFPRHDPSQHCSECQLFSGKAGDPTGHCSFYGGRVVPVNGWCRNFKPKKKAA